MSLTLHFESGPLEPEEVAVAIAAAKNIGLMYSYTTDENGEEVEHDEDGS